MTVRDQALKIIQNQPSDSTIDDIIHEISIIKAVNRSIEQSEKDEVISHEEFKAKVKLWK